MTNQLSLFGSAVAEKPSDRLFFALFPDAAAAARIAHTADRLRARLGLSGQPLATDRFHITLNHLGVFDGVPPGVVDKAFAAAAALDEAPFEVAFDRAASFAGRARNRPFVLQGGEGGAALIRFQKALGMAMMKAGLGRSVEANFTPHVTLLYDDQIVPAQAIDPIGWTAAELVLVHSRIGKTQHIRLGCWPLRQATHS